MLARLMVMLQFDGSWRFESPGPQIEFGYLRRQSNSREQTAEAHWWNGDARGLSVFLKFEQRSRVQFRRQPSHMMRPEFCTQLGPQLQVLGRDVLGRRFQARLCVVRRDRRPPTSAR